MLIVVSGCAEDSADEAMDASLGAPDAGAAPEAAIDAAVPREPPAFIEKARRDFDQLVQEHGDRYWYEIESCSTRVATGASTFMVVENGVAKAVAHRSYPRSECQHVIDAYSGERGSFPQLLDSCAALSSQQPGPSSVIIDPNGVVVTCYRAPATSPSCPHPCGSGFHIRRWGFGSLPGSWAPYDDAGAKCVGHSASWRLSDTRDAAVVSPNYSLGPCRTVTTTGADGGSDCRTLPSALVDAVEVPLAAAWRWSGDIDPGSPQYHPSFGEVADVELHAPSPAPAHHFRIGSECGAGFSCRTLPTPVEELRKLLKQLSSEYETYPRCIAP